MPLDLDVAPLGDGMFLLYSATADGAGQIDLDIIFQCLTPGQAQRAFAALAEVDPVAAQSPKLRIPGWGRPLQSADVERLSQVRGGTLLCLARDAALKLDHRECGKLSALGVARVVFRNVSLDEQIHALEFRPAGRFARLRNIARLLPHKVRALSDWPWLVRLGAAEIHTSVHGWQQSGRIEALPAAPDTDLALSYAVFEGTRQMPPLLSPHAQIGTEGNGRYSIWNQAVFLSPSEPERRHKRPYWLVRLDPKTEPCLQMVPRVVSASPSDDAAIERVLTQREREPFTLQPGDPIVVFTHALSAGGAERQFICLVEALTAAGYAVTLVVYNALVGENAHYLPQLRNAGIAVVDASAISTTERMQFCMRNFEAIRAVRSRIVAVGDRLISLAATFAALAPKAVIAQLDEPNILTGFAAHIAGVPRVALSFCNFNPTNFPYIYKDWYRPAYQLLSRSPRVRFAGNQRDANVDYADWIGMAPARVAYIPNAVARDTFPIPAEAELAAARSELKLATDTPVLLGVFRLSPEKDPLGFVEVCARVARHVPALRAFLVGVGPMQQPVEVRIAELGIAANLALLARRSDINVLMTLASVFLLTSSKEGMPNVLMEAQLMGTAAVSTRLPGTADAVRDGETAFLRPVGDIEGLAAACVDILGDPARAERMGGAARGFAEFHLLGRPATGAPLPRPPAGRGIEADPTALNQPPAAFLLLAHDLFRKPLSTFRDHAPRATRVGLPPGLHS